MATTNPAPSDESARGIAQTLSGYVAQNVTVTRSPVRQEYPDQQGAIRGGAEYDERFELTATVYSESSSREAPFAGESRIDFDGKRWALDSVEESGTYNDVLRWTVRAHRFTNWPSSAS